VAAVEQGGSPEVKACVSAEEEVALFVVIVKVVALAVVAVAFGVGRVLLWWVLKRCERVVVVAVEAVLLC